MRKIILIALLCSSCNNNNVIKNEKSSHKNPIIKKDIGCTVGKAQGEFINRIMNNGYGGDVICETKNYNENSNFKNIIMDGVSLSAGDTSSALTRMFLKNGGKIKNTFYGKSIVFSSKKPLTTNEKELGIDPFEVTHRYWLNYKNSRLVGFRRCDTYESGLYNNESNADVIKYYGAPSSIRYSSDANSPKMTMYWGNFASLKVFDSPNISRLDFGSVADGYSNASINSDIKMAKHLSKTMDFKNLDTDIDNLSIENCFSSKELEQKVMPTLKVDAYRETGNPSYIAN